MNNKEIRIIRSAHNKENPYFMLTRSVAQDRSLSWEARGILIYLLSKPDDWIVRPADLEQQCGENKVYRILHELRKAGYVSLFQLLNEAKRVIGWEYQITEIPEPLDDFPDVAFPDVAFPDVENNHVTYKRRILLIRDSTKEMLEQDFTKKRKNTGKHNERNSKDSAIRGRVVQGPGAKADSMGAAGESIRPPKIRPIPRR